ncbi:MAG: hypothetical protein Q9196_000574 [Gyalolechia fulgens]
MVSVAINELLTGRHVLKTPSFPLPSILDSLAHIFGTALDAISQILKRIANWLSTAAGSRSDGLPKASTTSSNNASHSSSKSTNCISQGAGGELGGAGDTFVVVGFERSHTDDIFDDLVPVDELVHQRTLNDETPRYVVSLGNFPNQAQRSMEVDHLITSEVPLNEMDEEPTTESEPFPNNQSFRPSKRRRISTRDSLDSTTTELINSGDVGDLHASESPSRDKENEDPDAAKAKKPKYRIHIPQNSTMPEDTFLTQPPSRSPSPYRIDKFCWKKPRLPEPPAFALANNKIQREVERTHVQPAENAVRPLPSQLSSADFDDGYDDVLADLPSDAFSSPEPQATNLSSEPIEISSQDPDVGGTSSQLPQARRLAAPLANLRQTTLFGDEAQAISSQTQTVRKRNWPKANKEELLTHHKLDPEAMKTWVYPTNLGNIRRYQYSIVASGLYHNMLVALPTGLGKTFIAATIMLNWFRWTTDAQIVFVAPTKPLVSQQVKACFEIAGIPRSTTTMLTGVTPPGVRAEEWKSKRVFFMTPQTIVNDLKAGICDPKKLVLLVVDEAHRATGGYAYVEVVQFLRRFNSSFRVLALTATPGASIEGVQEVIDGLGISRIEIRTEESLDIREYVYARKIETHLFDYTDEMLMIMDLYAKALQPLVDKLCGMNAYWGRDPMTLTPYGCNQARTRWMLSDAGRKANMGVKGMVNTIFSLLASLAHGIELLKFHGIGPFYHKVLAFRNDTRDASNKGSKYRKQIDESEPFEKMMSRVRTWINNPDFVGHPKLEHVQGVVLNHFLDAGEGRGASDPSGTRIMVFAHYRDSAEEIARVLKRNEPIIRPRVFVGQATSKSSEGMDQKTQLDVIQRFKNGIYNTLVATSIGEEGLDIGEVDLIICYDASASPIRMLQRMGRTGRKRAGNIVVTLMRGKEENNFIKAKDGYQKMQQEIAAGTRFSYHEEQSHRIVPRDIQPVVDKKVVEIPLENTQAELPEPSKRAKVPKRPPKKFHMPDGVRRGFVKASRLDDDRSIDSESAGEAQAERREESPEPLPPLSDVLLSAFEQKELERRYLDVKGDSPEIVEPPRVDTFPALQRDSRPTKYVSHGRMSKRTIKMLRLMHSFAGETGKDFEKFLHPEDRQDGILQAEKRASFFSGTVLSQHQVDSMRSGAIDAAVSEMEPDPLTDRSSPFPRTSQGNNGADKVTGHVQREISSDIEPDPLSSLPSPIPKWRTTFHDAAPMPNETASGSEEDLPDIRSLIKSPAAAGCSPSVMLARSKGSKLPPTKRRKRRRIVLENESDEE